MLSILRDEYFCLHKVLPMLTFTCPHCNHSSPDALEILDPKVVHDFTCEARNKAFYFHFLDRLREKETPYSFVAKPLNEELLQIFCHSGNRPWGGMAVGNASQE